METKIQTSETVLQLSQAEIEMIQLQREKAEIEQREKELKRKAELEKSVEERKKKIINAIALLKNQRSAAESYFLELELAKKGMFQLVKKEVNITEQVIDYSKEEREVYWEECVTDFEYEISVIGSKYKIVVYEHKVYSGKWSRSATNKGFHMFLRGAEWKDENKAIKNAKTMCNKIEAYIDAANSQKKYVDRQALAKQMALDFLKNEFPELVVEHEQKWVRSSYVKSGGCYVDKIKVLVPNGVVFNFHYNLVDKDGVDVIKVGLDNWANFDYKEVIAKISSLVPVNNK